MPDVIFKDLSIDATADGDQPSRVAAFWGTVLGQAATAVDERGAGGLHRLDPPPGGPDQRTIWVDAVPERPVGKSRVHLDIRTTDGDPAPLVAAGATVVRSPDDEIAWHVLQDPGGVPLCLFGPNPGWPDAPLGPFELVVDCADPDRLAAWWAVRTGGTGGQRPGQPFCWVEGAAGFPYGFWVFNPVPEPKTVKNRIHWDVVLDEATLDDLLAAGATLIRPADHEIRWNVLADPEGNEFCVFLPT